MIFLDCEQGSEEWLKARCGIITASNMSQIITATKKPSSQAGAYMDKLIAEKLTGSKSSIKSSEWMERGVELESEARLYYSFIAEDVKEVGFIYKDESKRVGCSPDGLLEDRGLEIKCPAPHTQVKYLLENKLPTEYVCQVQGSMYVTGLKKWDFLSYHPQMPPLLLTIERDDEFCAELDLMIGKFIIEMDEKWQKIQRIREGK